MDDPEDAANCVAPANSMEDLRAHPTPDLTPISSDDDDGSFRSVGSSTTDIFHPSQDDAGVGDQGPVQSAVDGVSSTGLKMEDDSREGESDGPAVGETDTSTLTDCSHTEPESQPDFRTEEALHPEGPVERLSKVDLFLCESGDAPMTADDAEPEEATHSESKAEHVASEDASSVLFITSPADESEAISSDDASEASAAGTSGDVRSGRPTQHTSEMPADERSPDEGLRHSEHQIKASLTHGVTPLSDEASGGPDAETLDSRDGGPQSPRGALQEGEGIVSEEAVVAAGEEDDGRSEETHSSTIHRDREASFHQPCSAQLSGSSQPSEFPSLPSRTSALRDSGSDIESLLSAEPGYDGVFRKSDDPVTGGDSTSEVSVSCSSTDETSSSLEGNQGLECSWSPEESIKSGAPGGGGEAEEEAKDRVTEVPLRSSILRNSIRSLSPLRRHSWGPGKNNGGDAEMNHRR
ncbi:hypothetical protein CgunFtcFv8_020260 [Champsocephalus gunnari]|uniref:Uncharacterized protein n=1 Tax=Champsocephalus gunnari TaxID=52237 RepID=A0AAN8E442_CHAGU|nr:hypothetical protein CgunFtcFv8_020260 [Champsocephalus gunnari]